jgi:hypothetical protein
MKINTPSLLVSTSVFKELIGIGEGGDSQMF